MVFNYWSKLYVHVKHVHRYITMFFVYCEKKVSRPDTAGASLGSVWIYFKPLERSKWQTRANGKVGPILTAQRATGHRSSIPRGQRDTSDQISTTREARSMFVCLQYTAPADWARTRGIYTLRKHWTHATFVLSIFFVLVLDVLLWELFCLGFLLSCVHQFVRKQVFYRNFDVHGRLYNDIY